MSDLVFAVATAQEFAMPSGVFERTVVDKPSSPSALHAYLALKSMFGAADRECLDDTKQQWTFLLKTDNALVEAYDWKQTSWSISVKEATGNTARAEEIAQALLLQVQKAAVKHSSVAAALQREPSGHVIENPYALYYQTAEDLIALADQRVGTTGEAVELMESDASLVRAAYFQLVAAFEGFLNVLYEIYLRRELRDERIVDRLAREQIDIKLRLAPVYCDCFQPQPLDHKTEAFRNFHTLANCRNDFIHANLTKHMRTAVVEYDGMIFVMPQESDPARLVAPTMGLMELKDVKRAKEIIDAMIAEVLAHMLPRSRREYEAVMHDEYINVEYVDGVPVVLPGA